VRVLLASLGTAGDVHPFLAIGRALAARGHAAELVSNPVFAPLAAQAGIGFAAVGREEHHRAAFAHHYIWHAVNGFGVMWRYLARPALPEALAHIASAWRQGPCVVLFSPFLMPAARIAAEAHGVPVIPAYTAPAMLPNFEPPLCVTRLRVPGWVPRSCARAAVEWLDRRKMQPLALPAVDAARTALGLAPLGESVFLRWLHGDGGGVTLFPDWFAAPTRDWPARTVQAGFPLWDGDAAAGLSPALEEFLAAGDAPVVVTAGTAMAQGAAFFARAVEACRVLGLRALLLARDAAQIPRELPPGVMHADYAPFGLLLPRARALLHHGGVGSSAQALRAGIAQLVVPHAYDQFDNAMRLERLGVGCTLSPGSGARRLARALGRHLADGSVATCAAQAAARMRAESGTDAVVAVVERFA
jgi:rhamnosyltransferase subunit B